MPSKIDIYQIGVWFCVGFFTERRLGARCVARGADFGFYPYLSDTDTGENVNASNGSASISFQAGLGGDTGRDMRIEFLAGCDLRKIGHIVNQDPLGCRDLPRWSRTLRRSRFLP